MMDVHAGRSGSEDEMIVETDDEMNIDVEGGGETDDDHSSIDEKDSVCSFLPGVVDGSENTMAGNLDPPSTASSSSKRDLILEELEEELEKQLDEKAIRNELSATNVKSLLKAVLTHADVRKYVEFALDRTDEPPEYQLKLTRAKAKELIDRLPNMAPLLCLPSTPMKKSDITMLLEESLADNSDDDDEYVPPEEVLDDDEESLFTNGDDSSVVSLMSPPDRSAASSPVPAHAFESVGLRTRSKFSLSTTPLEAIERAFVPPDVTEDMYNPISGNKEWLDFLNGLVQPLDPRADSVEAHSHENDAFDDNDDENDPEYNVMSDEELEAPDIEELRNDRNVKISKKEMSALMSELAEYTQMLEEGYHSDEENGEVDEAIEDLINAQPLAGIQDEAPATFPEMRIPYDDDGIVDMENLITYEHYLLIQQQLMQHTQLLLQTYLLSLGNPFVGAGTREGSKAYLVEIKALGDASPGSLFSLATMASTFSVMESYETHVLSNEKSFWHWLSLLCRFRFGVDRWYRDALYSGKRYVNIPVHPHLIEFCLLSCAFPYPLLLPKAGFKPSGFSQKNPFCEPIDRLICLALDDCVINLKMDINNKYGLNYACDVIRSTLLPDRLHDSIVKHVQSKKQSLRPNLIKEYFLGHGPPNVEHFVVPVTLEPLYNKDARLIDTSWHRVLYSVRKHIQIDSLRRN